MTIRLQQPLLVKSDQLWQYTLCGNRTWVSGDVTEEQANSNVEWLIAFRKELTRLPHDYPQSYEQLTGMRHLIQREIAQALESRLNEHVQTLPQETLAEKQRIASMVNEDLRLLNLCLRCPITGNPAILVADYRDDEAKTSRFRFQIVEPSGRQLRKAPSHHVPKLMIQESPPREEHFASRIRR